ncbi:MAG TPA: hypothetical protein VFK90_06310 [Anaeromyxobacter sp.]|nr:hypothetical protein [Anaeromyxobacter sp.]
MGKAAKVLLGAATAWPIAYLALFTRTLLDVVRAGFVAPPELVEGPALRLAATFAVHLATLVLIVLLGGFYARDAARSPRVPEDRRVPWLVANVAGGFLAQLPYWWLYVWRDAEPLATTAVRPGPSVQ